MLLILCMSLRSVQDIVNSWLGMTSNNNNIVTCKVCTVSMVVTPGLPLLFKRWPHWNRAKMHEIMLKNSVPGSSDMDHRL